MPYKDPEKRKQYQHEWYLKNKKSVRKATKESLKRSVPKRKKRWEEEFIGCKIHPAKRCAKSGYMHRAVRRCYTCLKHPPSYYRFRRTPQYKEHAYWSNLRRRKKRRIEETKI